MLFFLRNLHSTLIKYKVIANIPLRIESIDLHSTLIKYKARWESCSLVWIKYLHSTLIKYKATYDLNLETEFLSAFTFHSD